MTIQQDAKTQTISQQQIADENAAAAQVNGTASEQVQEGASDNLESSQVQTPEQKKQAADIVQEQHKQQAEDREAMMADIAARRRQHMREEHDELAEDLGLDNSEENQENQEQEQESGTAQDEQATQQDASPGQADQPRFFTDANGQPMVELLVNGKLTVVPQSRVIAAAQKLEAGDERLRQAAAERQRLEQERQTFEQQKLAAQQFKQPSVDPDAEAKLKTQLRSDLERLINEGDDSAMDALVESLVKGRTPAIPNIDPHQIAQEAIIIQNQQAWDTALLQASSVFDADPAYADVNGNEVLAAKATQYAQELVKKYDARNRNVPPLAIMQEAAQLARTEAQQMAQAIGLSAPAQNDPTKQVASRADMVAARKTQAGNTVTGGGQGRVASHEPAKVPDGGKNPNTRDAKVAAFAGLVASRTSPMIKR